jgi:RimJ/RimL family protein N-acetyltransferase
MSTTRERPRGDVVNVNRTCIFPPHEMLVGNVTLLVPMKEEHADQLFDNIAGKEHSALYDYMSYGPFDDLETFRAHIKHYASKQDPQFYTIIDNKTKKLVGHVSFLRIDVPNRVLEIGHVLFSRSLQKTRQATEVFYLLVSEAFGNEYRRVEWKCDSLNAASRRAALRLGFTFEGVFRQHMIIKGRNRDSAWYSITDGEWPTRKRAFDSWMDPANFDAEGRQQKKLQLDQELYAMLDGQ